MDRDAPDIRTLTVDDWEVWREVRLRSLADAPDAFASTLADWQGENDLEVRWRTRLTNVEFNAVATIGDAVVGTVGGVRSHPGAHRAETVELISLWVAPASRGSGVGDALIAAVVEWAMSCSASAVVLAVRTSNQRAITLYGRNGFVLSGPNAHDVAEDLMRRDLAAG